jgi:hypothetical protein
MKRDNIPLVKESVTLFVALTIDANWLGSPETPTLKIADFVASTTISRSQFAEK